MTSLATRIDDLRPALDPFLVIGKATWTTLIDKLRAQELARRTDFYDEQVWTFLVAVGYAAGGQAGVAGLTSQLTDGEGVWRNGHRIWFEVLPTPPRIREGNTNVDLAVGDLRLRPSVEGGVELEPGPNDSWACLAEAKWYSDISTKTTHHPERNQLARVAENVVCLQAEGEVVAQPHVTLITPERFLESELRPRLYAYKYEEYQADHTALLREWEAASATMPPRRVRDWQYPQDIALRAGNLRLHWTSYEGLLTEQTLPASEIKDDLIEAATSWNGASLP